MSYVVAVMGASGLVGREMVATLERRSFPVSRLVLLASPRSAGTRVPFRGEEIEVQAVGADSSPNRQLCTVAQPRFLYSAYMA